MIDDIPTPAYPGPEADPIPPIHLDSFPDKVGYDRDGNIRVRFKGEVQRPQFNSWGAAEAFLDGLKKGSRTPEPEEHDA